jgi:hypothetical protein
MPETAAERKARIQRELDDIQQDDSAAPSGARSRQLEENWHLADEKRAEREAAMKGDLDRELERRTDHPRHDALGDHDPDEKHTPLHKKLRRQWPTLEGVREVR